MIRVLFAKIFVWCLRKLKVSVIIGANIKVKEKICFPKFNISFIWYTDLRGITLKNWKECGEISIDDVTGEHGETIIAYQCAIKGQGKD